MMKPMLEICCGSFSDVKTAYENGISNSALDELVVTDTIPLSPAAQACSKIRQVSCAAIIGETLSRIAREASVSSLFSEC